VKLRDDREHQVVVARKPQVVIYEDYLELGSPRRCHQGGQRGMIGPRA
jgi:hypothetical protein